MSTIINAGKHDIVLTANIGNSLKALFDSLDFTSLFVLTDENTHRHCLPVISEFLPHGYIEIAVKAGELNKNLECCQAAWTQLLRHHADRNSLLINLGGGVVSDLGGFVAATYKRGIRFINLPTSLMGMVDASAGGKTGIDLDHYKNMIGTFSFPEQVIADPVFLNTLPDKEWKNGMAEMIKHGLIADGEIWNALKLVLVNKTGESVSNEIKSSVKNLLEKVIRVKANIVKADPFEKGERMFLNFGHTVGHALETYSLLHDAVPVSHGEAVAAGMICELFLSMKLYELPETETENICKLLAKFFPNELIPENSFPELIQLMKADKKSLEGKINYALLSDFCKPVIHHGISKELIIESFHFYNSLQE